MTYGANAVPVMGGSADPTRRVAAAGARPAIGSGSGLAGPAPVETAVEPDRRHCAGITKQGIPCGAPPAKGTEWCAGHLRSHLKGEG